MFAYVFPKFKINIDNMDFPCSFALQNLLVGFTFGFEKNLGLSVHACYNDTFFNISIHQNIIENINEDNKHI